MNFGKQKEPIFIRKDSRGEFKELLNSGKWQSLATGTMEKDAAMGYHYHKYTVVYFHLLSGKACIKTFNIETGEKASDMLNAGEGYVFRPEEVRIIKYLERSRFLLMKSHRYDPENPDLIAYNEDF